LEAKKARFAVLLAKQGYDADDPMLIVLPATWGPNEEGADEEGVDDEEESRRGGYTRRGEPPTRRA